MSYVIVKCLKDALEYFSGLDAVSGAPCWSDTVDKAQLWESRLHAESQALLLVRNGELGVQRKAVHIFTAWGGPALMPRLTQFPMAMKLGSGMVIVEITLGVRCLHCDAILRVGDTPFCPHKIETATEAK